MIKRWLRRQLDNLPYLTAALALALGFFTYYCAKQAWQDQFELRPLMLASEDWPHTLGVVVSHWVEEDVSGRFSHTPVTYYYGHPEYIFRVDGHEYSYDRVCPEGQNCGLGYDRESADNFLAIFPVGAKVTVYYDPDLTPEMAAHAKEEDDGRIWALLRPGYGAWVDDSIAKYWTWSGASALLTVLLLVYTVRNAPEFKDEPKDDAEA